jgi:hypothetical protein
MDSAIVRSLGAALSALAIGALLAPPASADPLIAHVAHTDGQNLAVRSGPGTQFPIIDWVPVDGYVQLYCQQAGELVESTSYWDFLPGFGGYAADHYLYTSVGNGRIASLPLCSDALTRRRQILDIARHQVGTTDGRVYGAATNDNWCQVFVNWVWRNANVTGMNTSAFTGDFYHWARARGLLHDGHDGIHSGDAVLFGTGPSTPDTSLHVGIVIAVNADGTLNTIDGNKAVNGVFQVARVTQVDPDSWTGPEPGPIYAYVSPPR